MYGYTITPPAAGEDLTPARLKAMADQLKWFRLKFASLLDRTVEPDDIEMDDTIRNLER